MSRKDTHDVKAADQQGADTKTGPMQAQPESSPLLVIRKQTDHEAVTPAEQQGNVVDLDAYRAHHEKQTVEETLVTEWHLNPGSAEPLVKLIMVSSGFGRKRSGQSRNTDIQCLAA